MNENQEVQLLWTGWIDRAWAEPGPILQGVANNREQAYELVRNWVEAQGIDAEPLAEDDSGVDLIEYNLAWGRWFVFVARVNENEELE